MFRAVNATGVRIVAGKAGERRNADHGEDEAGSDASRDQQVRLALALMEVCEHQLHLRLRYPACRDWLEREPCGESLGIARLASLRSHSQAKLVEKLPQTVIGGSERLDAPGKRKGKGKFETVMRAVSRAIDVAVPPRFGKLGGPQG